jgi:SAM-dependent methyltransferase
MAIQEKKPNYDPEKFWDDRFRHGLKLKTTGHRAFNEENNFWIYRAQIDAMEAILAKHRIDLTNRNVLDIGCGSGIILDFLRQNGAKKLTGLDISPNSIQYLKEKYTDVQFICADISSDKMTLDGQFDLVTVVSVFYHIVETGGFQNALETICRHLNPGGYLLFNDILYQWFSIPKHVKFRNIKTYQNQLNTYHCQILDIEPIYYLQNRTYIPYIGPFIINQLNLGKWFYKIDRYLRNHHFKLFSAGEFVLAQKID